MSIEYEVRDVIRIIIKYWYIALGSALICALISIPLSKKSYQSAVNDYNEKLEASQTVSEDTATETYIYILDSGNVKQEKKLAKDILELAKVKKEKDKDLGVQLAYYESINAVFIGKKHVRGNEYAEYIQNIKDEIEQVLLTGLNQNIRIDFKTVDNDQESVNMAELLLQQPTMGQTTIRVIGTAGVLGFLLGLVIIMILDYIKCCKKIISIKETVEKH